MTGLLPVLAFQQVWPRIQPRFGIRVIAVDAHPMASSEANVGDLENAIEKGIGVRTDLEAGFITAADGPTPPAGDVFLIGYSKGSPDILTLLARRPDLAPRIKGFAAWAGAVGGSYAANDIHDKINNMPEYDAVKGMSGEIGKLMLRMAPIVQIQRVNRRHHDLRGPLVPGAGHVRPGQVRPGERHATDTAAGQAAAAVRPASGEVPGQPLGSVLRRVPLVRQPGVDQAEGSLRRASPRWPRSSCS